MYLDNPKPQKQLSYALDNGIPIMIWIGSDEIESNTVRIKFMETKTERIISRDEIIPIVKKLMEGIDVLELIPVHKKEEEKDKIELEENTKKLE